MSKQVVDNEQNFSHSLDILNPGSIGLDDISPVYCAIVGYKHIQWGAWDGALTFAEVTGHKIYTDP